MEHKMSINLNRPIVPAIAIEMISGRTRLIGIPKEKIQVVITLPDIKEFNKELNDAIEFFKHRADAFVITSSKKEECNEVIDKFDLNEHLISNEHRDFSKIFKMRDETRRLKKSLMIIDTNCQITHKDVL
jgi:hypothetical protein